ncbi:MAG: carotenoid oxygenase family protein [Bacteriovorax sp.]|nr:carotenoid oxygenase family protein [Bacteriovorax sp.]
MDLKRRNFLGLTLLLLTPFSSKAALKDLIDVKTLKKRLTRKLSYQAYKTTTHEGAWSLTNIDGFIPDDIRGRFIKVGPGAKEVFTTPLQHYFDGDAYVSEFNFSENKIILRAFFLKTPQRLEEISQKKMLYDEFGTLSPYKKSKGRKNQPNINLIRWDESFLALSEGAHPLQLDNDTFDYKSTYDFNVTLPEKVSFTAHPKFDPDTKIGYCYGTYQGISKALNIFEMDPSTKKLKELYSLNQKHVYMIHDMLMTENFLIFIIPPAYFKLTDIILGKIPMAGALRFDKNEKTRILILSKNKKIPPIELTFPAHLVFHNGNAYEDNGKINIQTFLTKDETLLNLISNWQSNEEIIADLPKLHEIVIDLNTKKIDSIEEIISDHDFPVINEVFRSKKNQYLYATKMGNTHDPMAFNGISKINLFKKDSLFYPMKPEEVCGEVFFVTSNRDGQNEDSGYIAYQGNNASLDQGFLEFLNAKDLSFVGRVWADRYLPLGFHGHYFSN